MKKEDITSGTAGQTLIKAAGSACDVSDGSIADFLLVVKGLGLFLAVHVKISHRVMVGQFKENCLRISQWLIRIV